jgi:hypothetical protein
LTGIEVSHPSVEERFTEAARKAIHFAGQESLHRGAFAISAVDLLAGLSVEENTRAERVAALKANAFYLRWLTGLPALPARSEESIEPAVETTEVGPILQDLLPIPELDVEARRALGFAVIEADRDREYWIDSDHLLRGILRFPNRAHFAILKVEVDLRSARIASRADRHRFPTQHASRKKVFQYLFRKLLPLWVPTILSIACYLYILIEGSGTAASAVVR